MEKVSLGLGLNLQHAPPPRPLDPSISLPKSHQGFPCEVQKASWCFREAVILLWERVQPG